MKRTKINIRSIYRHLLDECKLHFDLRSEVKSDGCGKMENLDGTMETWKYYKCKICVKRIAIREAKYKIKQANRTQAQKDFDDGCCESVNNRHE
jgi:hypothetical protein